MDDLGRIFATLLIVGSLSLAAVWWVRQDHAREAIRLIQEFKDSTRFIASFIPRHFIAWPCPRCYESEMRLLRASPNGRSIQCQCTTCSKTFWFQGSSDAATHISGYLDRRMALLTDAVTLSRKARQVHEVLVFELTFDVPAAALPSERAGRESIPEATKHEVWRRDQGRCVQCGGQERLEFDHVIPVSGGGATTARNLQLLCEKCNRQKAAYI